MINGDFIDNRAPERLAEGEQIALLTGVGNHEAKLLTTAIIAAQPEKAFTESMLSKELRGRQADYEGWKPHTGIPFKYCRDSLEPIGAVVKEQVKGRAGLIAAYQASEFGTNWSLAFSGALLTWSLTHPEQSLIQIFGATASTSDVRSPEVRYRIYTELLTAPEATISYGEVAKSVQAESMDKKLLDSQLRDMATLGIVEIKSVQVDYNPRIRITNPNFTHVAYKFEDLKPETQAIYRAMQTLDGRGEVEINLDTLVAEAAKASPDLDVHTLRKKIPQSLHGYSRNFPGLELLDRAGIPESKRTDVTLKAELVEPLVNLCSMIEDVFSGNNLEAYALKARQIINDPLAFATLMAKVKKSSPNIIAQVEGSEVLGERLIGILQTLGQASIKSIRDELEVRGRRMSTEAVRVALRPLVDAGEVHLDKIPAAAAKKVKINHYSLKDTDFGSATSSK